MPRAKKPHHLFQPQLDQLADLREQIADLVEWARQHEMAGSGDPLERPMIEAELAAAEARVECTIAQLERELERS